MEAKEYDSNLGQAQPARLHWSSALQFVLSALAILALWTTAAGMMAVGLIEGATSGAAGLEGSLPLFLTAAGLAVSGVLLIPSAFFALLGMIGSQGRLESLPGLRGLRPTRLIFLFPLVILLGAWVVTQPDLAWFVLPPLHVLAIGLPVLWVLYLAQRSLPVGSSQRRWGVFSSGLVLGPALILVAEIAAGVFFVIMAALFISSQPELLQQIETLMARVIASGGSPEAMVQILSPLFAQPVFILGAFTFIAVIVPLLEELFKPIGVWLLAGARLSPAAGFAAGAISGAGYALFESLALASSGEDWAYLVVARVGTAVVHILTTGLTGWALVLAWRKGSWLRLGAAYLTAVIIHGLWNALALLSTLPQVLSEQAEPVAVEVLSRASIAAPAGLGVLTFGGLILLLWFNHLLSREQAG